MENDARGILISAEDVIPGNEYQEKNSTILNEYCSRVNPIHGMSWASVLPEAAPGPPTAAQGQEEQCFGRAGHILALLASSWQPSFRMLDLVFVNLKDSL